MGSNMAENHPIAFRFVMQAKAKGATVIHADPRFTRTSALADIYAPVRAGSDIAFLGGVIRYILENDLWFREYVMDYTNIATIISPDYQDPERAGRRVLRLGRGRQALHHGHVAVRGHGGAVAHWPNTTSIRPNPSRKPPSGRTKGPPPRTVPSSTPTASTRS